VRIKKDVYSRNEYVRAGGLWVRNFSNPDAQGLDINDLFSKDDYEVVLKNELNNSTLRNANITSERASINFEKCVIVSDGLRFDQREEFFKSIPSDVMIFAVNGVLPKWSWFKERPINLYIVNNPFTECLSYLPKKTKYYPFCVASYRTCYDFVRQYSGRLFMYTPTLARGFGSERRDGSLIDDYRNPICASISLAFLFNAHRLLLVGCDDSYEKERPATVQLENGFWSYPQQLQAQEVIDANLYWFKKRENARVADWSDGRKYNNAEYIENATQALAFLNDE
jgi:hypothetical protein